MPRPRLVRRVAGSAHQDRRPGLEAAAHEQLRRVFLRDARQQQDECTCIRDFTASVFRRVGTLAGQDYEGAERGLR
jgi:hypothetical protein